MVYSVWESLRLQMSWLFRAVSFLAHESELVVAIVCSETRISESDVMFSTMMGGDSGFVND